jgi:hypothetical protein
MYEKVFKRDNGLQVKLKIVWRLSENESKWQVSCYIREKRKKLWTPTFDRMSYNSRFLSNKERAIAERDSILNYVSEDELLEAMKTLHASLTPKPSTVILCFPSY